MSKSKFTTIGRKILMALSGFFLMFFLLQHLTINMLSVISPDTFNEVSQFMGTNPVVQFALQPVLIFAVFFHFIMGIILELQNRNARSIKYAYNKPGTNSNWMSRNMIYSGLVVLAFLGLHFYDFWVHEITVKYANGDMTGLVDPNDPNSGFRYYEELSEKFKDPTRVILYIISFVLLALHLLHGFQSSFQSAGITKGKNFIKKFGNVFGIAVPAGFVFIAIFHYLQH
ncbi:MAG: succinate dehydrogenase cytochrome b subunit [Flavobacteriales bacterium]